MKGLKKNIDKWNYYMSIIDNKSNTFIKELIEKKQISIITEYYIVIDDGDIVKLKIKNIKYNHNENTKILKYYTKNPRTTDIINIAEYATSDIQFNIDNIWCLYTSTTKGNNYNHTRNITTKLKENEYLTLEEAQKAAKQIKLQRIEENNFMKLHAKDANYDYEANGYKFLGWLNEWDFDNVAKKYPEYNYCNNQKHKHITVYTNKRGTENIVSCPICKIYWKYDSSD